LRLNFRKVKQVPNTTVGVEIIRDIIEPTPQAKLIFVPSSDETSFKINHTLCPKKFDSISGSRPGYRLTVSVFLYTRLQAGVIGILISKQETFCFGQ
jgi:hypothetical protein